MTWYGINVASMWHMDDVAPYGIWWGGIDITPTWRNCWCGRGGNARCRFRKRCEGVKFGKGVRVWMPTMVKWMLWQRNADTWLGMSHYKDTKWYTPKLLDGLNYEPKGEDIGRRRSWGALFSSQHFGGRGVCWSSEMGLGRLASNSLTHTNLQKPNNKLVNT